MARDTIITRSKISRSFCALGDRPAAVERLPQGAEAPYHTFFSDLPPEGGGTGVTSTFQKPVFLFVSKDQSFTTPVPGRSATLESREI